jgi:hypothetical protein
MQRTVEMLRSKRLGYRKNIGLASHFKIINLFFFEKWINIFRFAKDLFNEII